MNKKIHTLFAFIVGGYLANAQVGIGTENPNNSAQLEIVSNDKGILIPQVSLKSSVDTSTIVNGNVNSLLVFNTATISDITPGYYYWFSDKWLRLGYKSDTPSPVNSLIWDPVNNVFTYIDKAGNSQIVNLSQLIKDKETVTEVTNKGKGEYSYKNEKGTDVTISVIGDVKANIQDLLSDPNVKAAVSAVASKTEGAVGYDPAKNILVYADAKGQTQSVDLNGIVKKNETVTEVTNKGKGEYSYKNEKGTDVTISVIGDVKANIQDLLSDPNVKAAVSAVASKTEGAVGYDPVKNTLVYADAQGKTQSVDLNGIVKKNETVTEVTNKGKGEYSYKNEKGTDVTISVIGDVKANIQDLLSDPNVKAAVSAVASKTEGAVGYDPVKNTLVYADAQGQTQSVNLDGIVKNNETVTTLTKISVGKYSYTNEKGAVVTIDIANDVSGTATTIFKNPEVIKEFETVLKDKETVTEVTNKGKGEYSYKNEKGTEVTISVIGDVKANIQDLLSDPNVKAAVSAVASKIEGAVGYDPAKNILVYADAQGKTQSVNLDGIVKNNETVTTLTKISEGKYSYTNEKGAVVTIDIANDVSGTATTIFKNSEVIKELETVLKDKETVTEVTNKGKGEYSYKNEKGTEVTISVIGDVKANIQDLLSDPNVKAAVSAVASKTEGAVGYDPAKNILVYADAQGKTQSVNLDGIVKNNETVTTLTKISEGKYSYTNEKGAVVTIDIANDVSGTATTIFKNPEVIKEFETVLKDKETVTEVTNKGKGEYSYKNEKGTDVTISVIGDVKANIQDLLSDPNVKAAVSAVASKTEGAVGYDPAKNTLVYADAQGQTQSVDLNGIVKNKETVTEVTNKGKGEYSYKNEKGTDVTISVIGDVKANIQDLLSDPSVKAAVSAVASKTEGAVGYDPVKNILVYADAKGQTQSVDLNGIVKNKETVTEVTNKGKGEYSYKNEKGTEVTISVIGDVKANIQDLLSDPTVKAAVSAVASKTEGAVGYDPVKNTLVYADAQGQTQSVDLNGIVKKNETVTEVTNKGKGEYSYKNEKGTDVTISVIGDVKANIQDLLSDPSVKAAVSAVASKTEGAVGYDPAKNILVYADAQGQTQSVDLNGIVKNNETVTEVTNKGKGEYSYKNEKGTDVTISVIGDVKANIQDLLSDPNVKAAVSAVASKTEGAVGYDPAKNTLVYADAQGQTQSVNLDGIVKNNETVTTLTKISEGKYSYTNEKGAVVTIDIANDVSGTATTIFKNSEVIKELETVLKDKETVTEVTNKGKGEYSYKNEKGTDVTISVIGDVKANIQDLLSDPNVKAAVSAVASKTEGAVGYDPAKNILVYADAQGKTQSVNLDGIVKNNETVTTLTKISEGKYSYTNEKGAVVTIDVANDVSGTATTIFKNSEVIKELETVLKDKETVTEVTNKGKGEYSYKNEKGTNVTISVIGDVKANIQDLLSDPNVKAAVSAVASKTEGVVGYDPAKNTLVYADAQGQTQSVDLNGIVKNNETVTEVTNKGKGEYSYKNEKGTDVTISVIGDVKANIQDLLSDPNVKAAVSAVASKTEGVVGYDPAKNTLVYADAQGQTQSVNLDGIVKNNETVTTLTKISEGKYSYTNEKGAVVTIDIANDVSGTATTIFKNSEVIKELETVLKDKETVTEVTNKGKGEYSYKNEKGTDVTISVIGDVKANIQDLLSDPNVKVAVSAVASKTEGAVGYDPVKNILVYADAQGQTQSVNLDGIVKNNETVTTLTKISEGKYSYTNEKGAVVTIDIANDVSGTATTIFKNPEVIKELETVLKDKETVTEVTNKGKGEYSYKNEKGTEVTISVIGDVKANIQDLLSDPSVKAAVSAVASKTEGAVGYDPAKNTLVYADAQGQTQSVDLNGIVKNNETVTEVTNKGKGEYSYKNEKGTEVTISVIGDVKANIQDLLSDPTVKAAVSAVASKTEGAVGYDPVKNILVYADAQGQTQSVNLDGIVK
ncbi:hypothetical protein, partial [Flavobacterium poyangense]|uniref:hypothetical protein n=1 Tax=Flavobacterium poyangense TaxID=2204302 RepID=UPI0014205FD2